MDGTSFSDKFENFLDADNLKTQLIFGALFIAVFDYFKGTLINRIKGFYTFEMVDGKWKDDEYKREVLSKIKSEKSNKTIRATIAWLVDINAFSKEDAQNFKKMAELRDKLAHDMTTWLFEGFPTEWIKLYCDMVTLHKKFDRWWIENIEIPIAGLPDGGELEDVDWDEVTSVGSHFIDIMTDLALLNGEKYKDILAELKGEKNNGQ